MKGLCIEVAPKGALFQMDGEQPNPGFYYLMEDATGGTSAQNKAFHSLLNAFYEWMKKRDQFEFQDGTAVYDLRTPSQADFREFFKYHYGEGPSHYQYVSDDMDMHKAKRWEDIPEHIVLGQVEGHNTLLKVLAAGIKQYIELTGADRKLIFDTIYRPVRGYLINVPIEKRIKAVLKSWTEYTKKQRKNAIDNLFMLVRISKCDDKKVHEIMDGMEDTTDKVKRVFDGEEVPR